MTSWEPNLPLPTLDTFSHLSDGKQQLLLQEDFRAISPPSRAHPPAPGVCSHGTHTSLQPFVTYCDCLATGDYFAQVPAFP